MEMQVVHFGVHTKAQAEQIIRDALDIAETTESEDVHRSIIFREACRLLGARYTRPVPAPTEAAAELGRLLSVAPPGR